MKHIFLFCFFIVLAITISFIFDVSAVSGEKEIDVNVEVVSDNNSRMTNNAGNDAEGNYLGLEEVNFNEEVANSPVRGVNSNFMQEVGELASFRIPNTFIVPVIFILLLFVLIIGYLIFKGRKKAKRKRR